MGETRDDAWIASMSDRLHAVLGPDALGDEDGYTPEACDRLALAMHDLQLEGRAAGLTPGQQLLLALLREQPDIGDAEAVVIAGALPRLRLRRLLAFAPAMAELLRIDRTRLLRRRWDGEIEAALIATGSERASGAWYALWHGLHILAFQRQQPYRGGAVSSWPARLD